jgi:2'-5' RNA ligase
MSIARYDACWDEFIGGDHISRPSFGEGVALTLLYWLRDESIIQRLARLQRAVASAVPLKMIPLDALHITVRYIGELTDRPDKDSELKPDRVPELVAHLKATLHDFPSFPVALRRINSFRVCPFAEVHDGGMVLRIRDAVEPGLREMGFPRHEYGPRGFLPHLSLGYFDEEGDGAAARQVVAGIRDTDLGAAQVNALSLVKVPWSAGMYHLEAVEELPLA